MTLKAFLSAQGLTYEAFALRIGVTTAAAWRYANGKRMPRPVVMKRIVEETGSAVRPQDFYQQDAEGEEA